MTTEQARINGLKAVIAGIVSVLTGVGQYAGIAPEWTEPYFVGLIVTAGSALVSAWYASRRILAGQPAQGELPLA